MPTLSYNEVLDQAQNLTYEEQLRLLADLAAHLHRQGVPRKKHSIMELKGLGKEIWRGVDVEKYIDEERNSWDG